jgi:MinD-like ATPase involved in chromosome partitioning or flagellar assembly
VSAREGQPDGAAPRAGVGQDFSWLPPGSQPGGGHPGGQDSDTHDFGPRPLVPGVNAVSDEERTDSTRYPVQHPAQQPAQPEPAPQQPVHYVDPSQSGPLPQQYADPATSGPRQYPDPSTSGPHQQHPSTSGPHPYVDRTPSGSQPAQYVEATPSGPQQQFPPAGYQQQYPVAAQRPGQQQPGQPGEPRPLHADELSSAKLIKQSKRKPQSGWRKAVFVASGHLINVGESPNDLHRRELITRVNQPLRGCYKIAMLSLKGGVGKTTTTTTLGSTFSSLRGDRVIAVDANPDRGTLSQKIPLETTATVRHLLRDADRIHRYSDIRAYTSQGPSRLEVLASEQDPAVSEAFSEDDYRRTVALLEHFYNIVLTDCGTGLMHSAMKGVLDIADSLVIVSSGSVDGAMSASATLDWLDVHGYRELVARSVAVINSVRPRAGSVDLDKLAQHFGSRCRAVCRIPFDPHLEEGAEIELDRLGAPTRLALLELAATVADGFPSEFYYMR